MVPKCIELPAVDDPFEIPLPGGVSLEDVDPLQMLQSALAPLAPLFKVLDVVMQIFACIKAIPDAVGLPPDPSGLFACVPELAKKIAALLELLPILTIPILVKRVIKLVARALSKVRARLIALEEQVRMIESAIDRAKKLQDPGLMAIAQCARANVAQEGENLMKSLAGVGRILLIIQLFMSFIPGAPQIPDLSSLTGQPLDAVVEPLDAIISALDVAYHAIPIG
jgi:hypothetical protein